MVLKDVQRDGCPNGTVQGRGDWAWRGGAEPDTHLSPRMCRWLLLWACRWPGRRSSAHGSSVVAAHGPCRPGHAPIWSLPPCLSRSRVYPDPGGSQSLSGWECWCARGLQTHRSWPTTGQRQMSGPGLSDTPSTC